MISHRTAAQKSLGGWWWSRGQSQAHRRPLCVLSDLLRATKAGSVRAASLARVWSPVYVETLKGVSLLGAQVLGGSAGWGQEPQPGMGMKGSGGPTCLLENYHCTPSHPVDSVPDAVPQRGGAAGRSRCVSLFLLWGGGRPWEAALTARPAAGQAEGSLPTPPLKYL